MVNGTPSNGLNFPSFTKQAYIRNDFHPKANILEVFMMCRDNQVPGKLEIQLGGNGGVTAITYWEQHPVDVEPVE